ncbi:MAG: efflux transporter periplasmic adaptor subunit, partial [Capnocytophaga sp.]
MKKILIAVVILALGGGMAYRLHANKQKNAEEVAIVAQKEAQVAVRAAKVTQENVSDLFSANGTFVAAQDLNVSSEMG